MPPSTQPVLLSGDDEGDAEDETAAVELVDPFADAQRRLAVLGMVDLLVHVVRLAALEDLDVVLDQCCGIGLPDQLVVTLAGDVLAGEIADRLVAPEVAPVLVLDP